MTLFAEEMKRILTLLVCLVVSVTAATAEETFQYSMPFQGVEAASITSVILRTKGKSDAIKILDKEWIRTLLATLTNQDFPLRKGPMGFSLPGELCSIEFRDGSPKVLRIVVVFGAWNLLSVNTEGKSVLGSNRRFADAVIRKLEEVHPEFILKQRETYGKDLSGKYQKEYLDFLKSEQVGRGDGD